MFTSSSKARRREFEKRMEVRRAEDLDGEWHGIRRGWSLGDEECREELLAAVHDRPSEQPPGDLRVESAKQTAGRMVTEERSRLGWAEAELGQRAKGGAEKVSDAGSPGNDGDAGLDGGTSGGRQQRQCR